MDCSELHELVDCWLDNECEAAQAEQFSAHLVDCPHCQALVHSRRAFNAQLAGVLAHERQSAQQLSSNVVAQLTGNTAVQTSGTASPAASWFHLFWAAAAGFLLAVWIFGAPDSKSAAPLMTNTVNASEARVTAATGRVELFDAASKKWRTLEPQNPFGFDVACAVRTAPDGRCEIKTEDGCVLRLNDETEIVMVDERVVELRRGQIWCRAPESNPVEVRVVPATSESQTNLETKPPVFYCPRVDAAPASTFTCAQSTNDIEFMNTAGEVNIHTTAGQQQLAPGESAHFSNGEWMESKQAVCPILSTRWIHPLLAQKGSDDAELHDRVFEMLAQYGKGNEAKEYEREIRALGEYSVLPLIQYVHSLESREHADRRQVAMRLAADLAPVRFIPDFIELLEDSDGEVRVLAATTLTRLTGLDMGLPAERWREPSSETSSALPNWQQWWQQNQHRYPTTSEKSSSF